MLLNENLIVRNNEIPTVPMGDEISMLDVNSGKYFVLNDMGAVIWNKLENATSVNNLISDLLEEYEIDETSCREAVMTYLEDMSQKELIKVTG